MIPEHRGRNVLVQVQNSHGKAVVSLFSDPELTQCKGTQTGCHLSRFTTGRLLLKITWEKWQPMWLHFLLATTPTAPEGHNLNENHNLSEPFFISRNARQGPSLQTVSLASGGCFLSMLQRGKAYRERGRQR